MTIISPLLSILIILAAFLLGLLAGVLIAGRLTRHILHKAGWQLDANNQVVPYATQENKNA